MLVHNMKVIKRVSIQREDRENKFLFSYIRIKKSFEKLSAELQEKLSNAKDFAKATIEELKKVPQDLLSSLQVCV